MVLILCMFTVLHGSLELLEFIGAPLTSFTEAFYFTVYFDELLFHVQGYSLHLSPSGLEQLVLVFQTEFHIFLVLLHALKPAVKFLLERGNLLQDFVFNFLLDIR